MKPLFIPLKAEHYDAFDDGSKGTEYRLYGPRWNEKNCYPGRLATLSRGYGKKHRLSGVVRDFQRLPVRMLPMDVRRDVAEIYGPGEHDIAAIGIDPFPGPDPAHGYVPVCTPGKEADCGDA